MKNKDVYILYSETKLNLKSLYKNYYYCFEDELEEKYHKYVLGKQSYESIQPLLKNNLLNLEINKEYIDNFSILEGETIKLINKTKTHFKFYCKKLDIYLVVRRDKCKVM